jgi:hypothetical protein
MSHSSLIVARLAKSEREDLRTRHAIGSLDEAYVVGGSKELVGRMLTALAQMPESALSSLARLLTDEASLRSNTEQLIAAFVPADMAKFQQDRQAQVLGNTQLRNQFLAENQTLSSAEVAEGASSRSTNRSALAWQWRSKGHIFGVPLGGQWRYPAFQIDPATGRPRPVIRKVLDILGGRLGDWGTALWFAAPNARLGGARPIDRLDEESAFLAAAEAVITQPDF